VHTITTEVSDLEGVQSVVADAQTRKATIRFDPPASEERIKRLLAEIHYPAAN
jgi:copper chaperone CopZ